MSKVDGVSIPTELQSQKVCFILHLIYISVLNDSHNLRMLLKLIHSPTEMKMGLFHEVMEASYLISQSV